MKPVAVLAGGPSSEHSVSLATASEMLATLRRGWSARPVVIDRCGGWVVGEPQDGLDDLTGRPAVSADVALTGLRTRGEVALLGLHGRFGEDGTVQRLLDAAGVPYTGSGAPASALCMDKARAKLAAQQVGAICAHHTVVTDGEAPAAHLQKTVGLPCVVKPVSGGSSVATAIVRRLGDLPAAVAAAHNEDVHGRALVEQHVTGRELTCGVIRRLGQVQCLPLVAIEPRADQFYDYHAKYETEATRLQCPAAVSEPVRVEIERVSRALYERLELRGVVRLDFLLDGEREQPVFLEVNTLPGFTAHSLVPLAAREAGISPEELLRLLLEDTGEQP